MPSCRCFLCDGSHSDERCTTYRTLKERENAVEALKLCSQCLKPTVARHLHSRLACNHCGKDHHRALCPLEPWRIGTTCAFCLGYHHSDACDKYKRVRERLQCADNFNICSRCLSRSHMEDDCTSTHRCKACRGRHHYALCPMGDRTQKEETECMLQRRRIVGSISSPSKKPSENDVTDDTDEIEVIGVVQASKSKEPSYGETKKASSSSEYRKQVDKLKAEVNDGRREVRLAKEAKRRAERERDSARKERDDAQDKCKELEKRIRSLEEENRNCEAIRQVTAAAVDASIEIVTNREEERRRAIEKERDDAANKLLEAEKRIEALKKAASGAVRLTFEFQAWRIRAALNAKKGGIPHQKVNNNLENVAGNVATVVHKTVKDEAVTAPKESTRKRPSASSALAEKRRRTESVKPSAEELSQKLDVILRGQSTAISEKYKLFFAENLRGTVTVEELALFVKLRYSNDVDLANNIISSFSTSA